MKTTVALVMSILFFALAVAAQTPNTGWYTANPEADTFYISTADELAGLAALVNGGNYFRDKTVALASDIDLSPYGKGSAFNGGKGWVPIGSGVYLVEIDDGSYSYEAPHAFGGVFDGRGKTVSGLYINDAELEHAGLFGIVIGDLDDVAEILNLGILDAEITGGDNVGALAGLTSICLVSNCHSSGIINGLDKVGGLIGTIIDTGVRAAHSSATVDGRNSVGGIVGTIDNANGSVLGSYSTGSVTGVNDVGGVVGAGAVLGGDRNGYVNNNYSTGEVAGVDNVGGIVGRGNVSNSYSTGTITGNNYVGGITGYGDASNSYSIAAVVGNSYVGGIAGSTIWASESCAALNPIITATGNYIGRISGWKRREEKSVAFDDMVVTFDIDPRENINRKSINLDGTMGGRFVRNEVVWPYPEWTTENGKLPGLFGNAVDMPEHLKYSGDLAWYTGASSPYIINYNYELAEFAALVNAGTDDFSGKTVKLAADIDLTNLDFSYSANGWTPVGSEEARPFRGTFDGNGKTISGLHINTENHAGLFGVVDGGIIKNLGIIAPSVHGSAGYTGGIAAYVKNGGRIEGSYVSAGHISGGDNVGGIAGYVESGGRVEHSRVMSSVSGNDRVGGVVGYLGSGSRVDECFVNINTVYANDNVGGIAGYISESDVVNSYSIANPMGRNNIGGVAGYLGGGNIIGVYAIGPVRGADNVGGIAGHIGGGSVTNSAALNSEVNASATGGISGRVAGLALASDEITLSGNVGFDEMILIGDHNGGEENDLLDASTRNGADITIDEIKADGTINGLFVNADIWTTENERLPGLFGNTVELPIHLGGTFNVSIAEAERDVSVVVDNNDDVAVILPVAPRVSKFTAGPNPVSTGASAINFFYQGRTIKRGTLTVYDAAGNLVKRIAVSGGNMTIIDGGARRLIASWDLTNTRSRKVANGTYLVRGSLTAADGKRERVSLVVGIGN